MSALHAGGETNFKYDQRHAVVVLRLGAREELAVRLGLVTVNELEGLVRLATELTVRLLKL